MKHHLSHNFDSDFHCRQKRSNMKNRTSSLIWISTFLLFINNAVAFVPRQQATRHHVASLYHSPAAASPLYYRDRDTTEEQLTDSISSTKTSRSQNAFAGSGSDSDDSSGVSMTSIRAIWFNQASIFLFATALVAGASIAFGGPADFSLLHWNGSPSFHSFFDWDLTSLRLLEGFLATLPLIALGSLVEKSDTRDASRVNFSTTNMVISLFGRRKSPSEPDATGSPVAMFLSGAIALSTGISEEIVFRGYIPMAIASLTDSIPYALLGQAILFAFAHISPRSTSGENKVVGGLQFANGLWYGLVYLMSGGDILPCIMAHMLYDMHVLCETWCVINQQMDYTEQAFQHHLDEEEEQAVQRIQQQAGPSLNTETLNFARRFFYAFDYEHKGTLSLSDVQRAVSYAFLKDKATPEPEKVQAVFDKVLETRTESSHTPAERLSVPEFLRVLFALKSRGGAVA
jgi:membrane protease YdiL (CAAX protease family)